MTSLGIYLLASLTFVIVIMAEFAVVLYLERKRDLKGGTNVGIEKPSRASDSIQRKIFSAKIDAVVFALLLMSFLAFNFVYWTYYLN